MDKIKNLSVRKTIMLYMSVSLICSFLLSAVIVKMASRTQERIWWKYVDQDQYFKALDGENGEVPYYRAEVPRPSSLDMSRSDYGLSELCDFLQTYTVLILSITGSFRRMAVQEIYLWILSAAGYGMFYVVQKPYSPDAV